MEIQEDLGIFNPFKEQLSRIQDGFKKAVAQEVKSERTKSELITNVSHDLKTPLTAIITYVNLLKQENVEGKTEEEISDVVIGTGRYKFVEQVKERMHSLVRAQLPFVKKLSRQTRRYSCLKNRG